MNKIEEINHSFLKKFHLIINRRMLTEGNTSILDGNTSILEANKSILNNSKTKMMFTFTKEKRFMEDSIHESRFYDVKSQSPTRATTFGFGNKIDIGLNNHTPSPDRYSFPSQFDPNIKKGLSIGHGREECKSVSIFPDQLGPGPANYHIKYCTQVSQKATIRPKLEFPSLFPNTAAPGPGAYRSETDDQNGNCLTSKYRSTRGFRICKGESKENNKTKEMLIGPGSYEIALPFSGKQFLAKNRTQKTFYFSRMDRPSIFNQLKKTPGPGAYKHFSMFGV